MIDVRLYAGRGPDMLVLGTTSDGLPDFSSTKKLCVPGREMHCGHGIPVRFMVPDPDFLLENRAEFDQESEKWCIREQGACFDIFYYIPAMWGLRIG